MIRQQLHQKYHLQFNFYLTKYINEVVQNETNALSTIIYKDLVILSDRNEYLKRMYHMKNSYGRSEINDRISMLADFYDSTVFVKYEHPMMIISGTKDIFLKRIKRMKKMIASDCSSQETSSILSEESSPLEFESSGFLHSIRTEELSKSSNSINREPISFDKGYQSSAYDIFQENVFDFSQTIYHPELRPLKIEFIEAQNESEDTVSHLICDIDDVDKEKAVKLYEKVKEKENSTVVVDFNVSEKKSQMKSSIVITPIDNYVPIENEERMREDSFKGKHFMKNSKIFKKQPQRIRQYDEDIYDETIRLNKNKNLPISSNNNIKAKLIRSKFIPGKSNFDFKQTERDRFIYHSPHEDFETRRHRKGDQESLYGQSQYVHEKGKKQKIRERAAALLQKVRSEQNLKMSYEPRRYPHY